MAAKISQKQLEAWVAKGEELTKGDGDNLYVTISKAGTVSWVLRYRLAGKGKEKTLGRYPDITLSEARRLALQERAKVQQGVDVAKEKRKQLEALAKAMTVRRLIEDYKLRMLPELAANTIKARLRYLDKRILPAIGHLNVEEVSPGDVVHLLERVGNSSYTVAAEVETVLRGLFDFAMGRRMIYSNPCAGIKLKAILGRPPAVRPRVALTDAELSIFLAELDANMTRRNALIVKLLLYTGTRIGEPTSAQWLHVDFERAEWFIPADTAKNRHEFTIPLAPAVLAVFRELEELACGSRYIYPAQSGTRAERFGGDAPGEQRAINHQLTDFCARLAGRVRAVTPHDIRSTFRTGLSKLGVPRHISERCLNHTLGGLEGIYDKYDLIAERREALESWADKVASLK